MIFDWIVVVRIIKVLIAFEKDCQRGKTIKDLLI